MPPTIFASSPMAHGSATMTPSKRRKAAARCLFGSPDHDAAQKWIHSQLDQIQAEKARFWNYDFAMERPIEEQEQTSSSETGQTSSSSFWDWSNQPAGTVPQFYQEKTVTSPSPSQAKAKRNSLIRKTIDFNENIRSAAPSSSTTSPCHTSTAIASSPVTPSRGVQSKMTGTVRLKYFFRK